VLGVRWGGDFVPIPNFLAVRAGGFFESKGQRDELLNLDFHMGYKAGISFGGTVRVGPADLHLAYQHVFYGTLDNGGRGALKALSGDATTNFRSQQPVNGGSFSQSLDEIAAGATFRY
jgi:long-chain fatty acid transport protein